MDKAVKDAGRDTVKSNMEYDRKTNGVRPRFARIPNAGACDFCKTLGSRGFVYHSKSDAGADDPFHPHCQCAIAVSFDMTLDRYVKNEVKVTRGHANSAHIVRKGRKNDKGELPSIEKYDEEALFAQYQGFSIDSNVAKRSNKLKSKTAQLTAPEKGGSPFTDLDSYETFIREAEDMADLERRCNIVDAWWVKPREGNIAVQWKYLGRVVMELKREFSNAKTAA